MAAISVNSISKQFRLHHDRPRSLQELVLDTLRGARNGRSTEFWALKDVSFEVQPGETLALIGENGSGKSTLLKLIARILEPTRGQIESHGRVAGLLELGAGFHPDLTGRDNVYLNGSILGLDRREMTARFDDIVSFAELERFIDVPLKHYSSGMQVRLGFAIATSIDPDILLIDEVLAVGDESFQHKCLDRIDEFRAKGRTIILVSHDLATVNDLCDRAVWLEDGAIQGIGLTRRVVDMYLTSVGQKENEQLAAQHQHHLTQSDTPPVAAQVPVATGQMEGIPQGSADSERPLETETSPAHVERHDAGEASDEETAPVGANGEPTHWGTGEIRITDVQVINGAGEQTFVIQSGEPMTIEIAYRSQIDTEDVVFGIGIYRSDGVFCYGTNTDLEDIACPLIAGSASVVGIDFGRFAFIDGTYSLDVAIHTSKGMAYDYRRGYTTFAVRSRHKDLGVFRPEHRWRIGGDGPPACPPDMDELAAAESS